MLSSTNSVTDLKAKLINGFASFGYTSDAQFTTALRNALDEVYLSYFLPRIGAIAYNQMKAKDKVSLTAVETYLYWAEIYMACVEFLNMKEAASGQLQTASDEMLSVEGYTHRVGRAGAGGASQGDLSVNYYWGKAYQYFKLAGIDIASIQRTCTIFGDTEPLEDIIDIITP